MKKFWYETVTPKDIEGFTADFWGNHRDDLASSEFWADRIKTLEGGDRLKLAVENLPLPAAFRHAMIAIRQLTRDAMKSGCDCEKHLVFLYWLAAVESFLLPYSERLQQPGYNVFSTIPSAVFKKLPFTYKSLGYKNLPLLNKTDVKWLVSRWGEPDSHMTLNAMHKDVWDYYEQKVFEKEKKTKVWLRG